MSERQFKPLVADKNGDMRQLTDDDKAIMEEGLQRIREGETLADLQADEEWYERLKTAVFTDAQWRIRRGEPCEIEIA